MATARRSPTREIAEWLGSRDGRSADFEFSGFAETRPVLTSQGLGRGADLATMLRSAPAARVAIAGDEDQASALAHFLIDHGIELDRIKIVPAAEIGPLLLTIDRGSAAPLFSAKS
jgi:hypothetical protein